MRIAVRLRSLGLLWALTLTPIPSFCADSAADPAADPAVDKGPVLPTPATHEFHFVVLGDSQFDDPVAANRLYDDVRWLKPAFVVQVGDMIGGYAGPEQLAQEWRRFLNQIAPLQSSHVPFLPVPGNHDVFGAAKRPDDASLAVYESFWGRAYYAFRYRNLIALVLNSDPVGDANSIDAEQMAWIERTLAAASDARHRVVFMHRPPAFLDNGTELVALLKRFDVRTLFYGHHHHYHQRIDDGITYVMTNGTGDSGTELDSAGSFDHLLQVSVRDDELTYAVIRADSIEAPGYAVPEDNYDLFALRRALSRLEVQLEPVNHSTAEASRFRATLDLANPSRREVQLYLSCRSGDDRLRFEPKRLEPVRVPSKGSRTVSIDVFEDPRAASEATARCRVRFPFQTADGHWHMPEVEIELMRDAVPSS
ncbi:MAG: metallophosphoesterase [Pseudomonadota bacterium]